MTTTIDDSIEIMASEIRNQAKELKVDTFLQFMYTADILKKFLDIDRI